MTDPWRPLGLALLDYHRGRHDAVFTVRSDLWEDEQTPVADYYRPDSRRLPEIDKRALGLCRGRVLDLGAGAGRHALELQRRGLDVTAVDISPEAVQVMRERGVADARCGDIFTFTGRYDTILLLMHGIGVVGTIEGLRRFLARIPLLLNPGGLVLADSADLTTELLESARGDELPVADALRAAEVEFQLCYRDMVGPSYPWLFVDVRTLEREAADAGLSSQVITLGERGGFLAKIGCV